ncbi:MAG: hypothetical protein IJ661_04000 [Lachnospiraceae bacterium]|nr:hypothetical protein [Lachnospiraceae bacterium]
MKLKDNTLYLHIGMPKSGTSAIQTFLYKNNEKLKSYGYEYPDLKGELINKFDYREDLREKNGSVLTESPHYVSFHYGGAKVDLYMEFD